MVTQANWRSATTCARRLETEDLGPASHELAWLVTKLRQRQLKGMDELNLWTAEIFCRLPMLGDA